MTNEDKLIAWAKQIREIAQNGLTYTMDKFDKIRFEELHNLSNEMLENVSNFSKREIEKILPIESGYATPKIAVRAIIMKENQLLMVKEAADGMWTLPGGWCDNTFTASENAIKEVREETGLSVEAIQLVALFDQTKYRESVTMQHIYTAYFLCEVEDGDLQTSMETTDVGYFPIDDLPPLSEERMTMEQFTKAMNVIKNNEPAYFD